MAIRFRLEQSTDGIVTSHAGMALVGLFINKYTDLKRDIDGFLPSTRGIGHFDIAKTYTGLMCQGKNDFEAVNGVQGDVYFQRALDIKQIPSEATLRQRFDEFAREFSSCFDRAAIQLLNRAKVPISTLSTGHVALDIDGTPFNNSGTKKEGVERTYKGFDGYGAMMAYLGEEGWCIGAELKPGSWHGQFEFDHFLERILPRARQLTDKPLLVRLDGGHDAKDNRMSFVEAGVDYIIRWNPRHKGSSDVHDYMSKMGADELIWTQKREGKRQAIFSQQVEGEGRRVIRVTEESIDRLGQPMLLPKIEVTGWWTSLDVKDEVIIRLYELHGTSEQFHSEFKTDLDMERFPSGKFDTNDLVLAAGALAYNILRIIGQMSLVGDLMPARHRAKRRRIRTVIQELMYLAARVIRTGRRWALQFSSHCPAFAAFDTIYRDLLAKPIRC